MHDQLVTACHGMSRLRKLLPGIFPVFVKTGNDLGKTARFFLNLFLKTAI